jgi:hypothetical protein
MTMIEIKNRFTGAVLFRSESATTTRQALEEAVMARADLTGAYLARANLADADLTDANLADADLADANLAGANLAGANLADADLADANLADANLADAYLAGAYLAGAYLARADLTDANLADAYLARAVNLPPGVAANSPAEPYKPARTPADFAARAERYRQLHPEVPVVEALDRKILDVITSGAGALNMRKWHTCDTTHCRAGWAIHLAGERGRELEKRHGSERAGAMIYRASTGRVPHFYASNERALEDIRARAAEQTEAGGGNK